MLPCNEPHDFEMVATGDFIGQQAYSDRLFDAGLDRCFVLAESYLDLEQIPEDCSLTFSSQPKMAGPREIAAISVTSTPTTASR